MAESDTAENQVRLTAQLAEISALRTTPAGVPVRSFMLMHRSKQIEAGLPREVECEVEAMSLGQTAHLIGQAPIGAQLLLTGFLARKSLRSAKLVLHVNTIEFVEGNENGIQAGKQA